MSVGQRDLAVELQYPESDGKPLAETDIHRQLIIDLIFALENFFRNAPDVYVSGNLLLYYEEGNPKKNLSPDVFVARGVGKSPRRVYKLWEEGHPPEVVIEVSSRATWGEDLQKKWMLYAQMGVKEYFIFDPEYDYLATPLLAYRLEEGQFVPLEVKDGRVRSQVLGLELVDTGETLRLLEPQTGQFLLTPREVEQARQQAEAEVARLREELERLQQRTSSITEQTVTEINRDG